ncbi:hypothetical protein KIPB_007584 [Kipferlia bialata]|uniref:Uncharacterized protein n=1 Tax=Kipferlia bialata TaxID=797122 RepID=A0A9K3GKT1_9EUKA|nr:hypothetical protein KIPB_007584 [Kipferlia bialata]|eukprot:g7584.t1
MEEQLEETSFEGSGAYQAYIKSCDDLQIHANSQVIIILKNAPAVGPVLDFSRNYLGDRGVVALAEGLRLCVDSITEVNLHGCGVRNNGMTALCDVFKGSNLRVLDISRNDISARGCQNILELIKATPSLELLDFRYNKLMRADDKLRIQQAMARGKK